MGGIVLYLHHITASTSWTGKFMGSEGKTSDAVLRKTLIASYQDNFSINVSNLIFHLTHILQSSAAKSKQPKKKDLYTPNRM